MPAGRLARLGATPDSHHGLLAALVLICALVPVAAQDPDVPTWRVTTASRLSLPGAIDSSNPMVWDLVEGQPRLFVFSSWGGVPTRSEGPSLEGLVQGDPPTFDPHPGHGVWMESIIADEGGTWYGYYHHEWPAEKCGRLDRQLPRIGAVKSSDRGMTHDPKEGPTKHRDFIQGVVSWESHHEMWRLYQSGQFVHFFSMREDWLKNAGHTNVEPGTTLGTIMTVYTLTEIFAFAGRLAEAVPFTQDVAVAYKIRPLGGRQLETFDPMRAPMWSGGRAANDLEEFGNTVRLPLPEFVARANELAVDQALEIFDRFDWSPPRELLLEDQRKFLQRRS